jgi:hypothetical protein
MTTIFNGIEIDWNDYESVGFIDSYDQECTIFGEGSDGNDYATSGMVSCGEIVQVDEEYIEVE